MRASRLTRPDTTIRDRLPVPGPSFLKPLELRRGDLVAEVGLARPAAADGWWTTILWAADPGGLVDFVDLAPTGGPPPDPPLARLGPSFAGGLSGFILEADGRLQLRLGAVIPPAEPDRPWRGPALVRLALRWEPARAAALGESQLASEALVAFRRALESLGRP
jgi:hypothetical protein